MRIAEAVGSIDGIDERERRVILEIAYCAVASDRQIDESERAALRLLAAKLAAGEVDSDALVARLEAAEDREVASNRLRKLASMLSSTHAKEVAYKAATALARADNEASDGEFEFDLELIDALGLDQNVADRLVNEVDQVLT